MTTLLTLDNPMLFSVWANVDSSSLLKAAKHLAGVWPLSLAQCYQLVKQASEDNRKIQVWSMKNNRQAQELAMAPLPSGFVFGSSTVAEDVADPKSSKYCTEHACFYGRSCSVCNGNFL